MVIYPLLTGTACHVQDIAQISPPGESGRQRAAQQFPSLGTHAAAAALRGGRKALRIAELRGRKSLDHRARWPRTS